MFETTQNAQQYWDERSELFGNYYEKPTRFDKIFREAVFTRVAVAVKTCQSLDKPTVLDVGSGPGVNSLSLIKNGNASHVTGIDFAPNMIKDAIERADKENMSDKTHFFEGDFATHNFGQDKFDLSIALGVFDYIEDAPNFLKKMCEVSNKAVVGSWPENGLRMFLRKYRYDCPLFHYTEQDLRDLHAKCNISKLDIVKSKGGWVTIAWI